MKKRKKNISAANKLFKRSGYNFYFIQKICLFLEAKRLRSLPFLYNVMVFCIILYKNYYLKNRKGNHH